MKVIDNLKIRLDRIQSDDNTSAEEVAEVQEQLRLALVEEETFWRNKSRVLWLEEGDKNTKFFHGLTQQRRARNRNTGILTFEGICTEKESEIKNTTARYFQEMFSSSVVSDLETSLAHVPMSVIAAMNEALTREVSAVEIKAIVFAIHPEKAP